MQVQDYDRRITAYHEAGHVVIGWLVGYPVRSVRLFAGSQRPGKRGVTYYRTSSHSKRFHSAVIGSKRTCPDIEAAIDVVVLLAGMAAEVRFDPLLSRTTKEVT